MDVHWTSPDRAGNKTVSRRLESIHAPLQPVRIAARFFPFHRRTPSMRAQRSESAPEVRDRLCVLPKRRQQRESEGWRYRHRSLATGRLLLAPPWHSNRRWKRILQVRFRSTMRAQHGSFRQPEQQAARDLIAGRRRPSVLQNKTRKKNAQKFIHPFALIRGQRAAISSMQSLHLKITNHYKPRRVVGESVSVTPKVNGPQIQNTSLLCRVGLKCFRPESWRNHFSCFMK